MNKRIRKKLTKQYCAWLNYESGFSGTGTSLLDIKPKFSKPKFKDKHGQRLKRKLDTDGEIWAKAKHDAFRKACIDVLGEDPETDWQ